MADLCIDNFVGDCWFDDVNNELCKIEKRFVLYWWFAANAYLIYRVYNRCELPQ